MSGPTDVIQAGTTPPTTATRPAVLTSPSFTGVLARGQTLRGAAGAWSGTTPMTFSYQWQRCPATGSACTSIPSATGPSYTLTAADVGRRIRLLVTATNAAGSAQAFSPISQRVAARATARGKTIKGTAKADGLTGTAAADTIRGRGGNDRISGRAGADKLYGDAGNDSITPGPGRDTVFGGSGNDDRADVVKGCEKVRR